jgi:hypothetical protein
MKQAGSPPTLATAACATGPGPGPGTRRDSRSRCSGTNAGADTYSSGPYTCPRRDSHTRCTSTGHDHGRLWFHTHARCTNSPPGQYACSTSARSHTTSPHTTAAPCGTSFCSRANRRHDHHNGAGELQKLHEAGHRDSPVGRKRVETKHETDQHVTTDSAPLARNGPRGDTDDA